MQIAASRLYIFVTIAVVIIQSAFSHIDNPITATHLAEALHPSNAAPLQQGFLQDPPNDIQPYLLFQVLLKVFYIFGDYGLILLQAIYLLTITILLIYLARHCSTYRRNRRLSSLSALALTALFITSTAYWNLTPQTTAILFTIATVLFLIQHRRQADWLSFWPLFLIQTLWNYTNDWYWVGLTLITIFSIEMILRESFEIGRWSLLAFQNWWPVILLATLTLMFAPHTWKTSFHLLSTLISGQFHLYPLEIGTSPWIHNPVFSFFASLLIAITVLNIFLHYGQTFWSLAILAFCFGWNTLSSDTFTPLFLVFTALTLLSASYLGPRVSGIHSPQTRLISTALTLISLVILTSYLWISIVSQNTFGLRFKWQQHNNNSNLIPYDAVQWLKTHASQNARILHKPELFGHLIIHGLSSSQTTLTPLTLKYSPDTRRKAFLLTHRPSTLGLFIDKYKPDYVLVDLPSYAWIPILRTHQYRPVFATHNASLWTQHPHHPTADLITPLYNFSDTSPIPTHHQLFRILTLAAADRIDLAWERLQKMPPHVHQTPLFSHTLNALSFHFNPPPPEITAAILDWLQIHSYPKLPQWAISWHCLHHLRKTEYKQAITYASNITHPHKYTLIGQLHLALNQPTEALKSLQKNPLFSPFNPRHPLYTARAQMALGNHDQAALAYQLALTYAPDDIHLQQEIRSLLKQHDYLTLRQIISKIKEAPLSIPSL